MSRTMKKVSALLLAILMVVTYMPLMQEPVYAAKKAKKPAAVKGLKHTEEGKKITLTWKKAKNAKKYSVSIKDGSTGLTATKSSKKTKLSFNGQWATKYTIQVKGINGKKKGKAAKTIVELPADPEKTAALEKAAESEKAADALSKELEAVKTQLAKADKLNDVDEAVVEKAKAIVDAYNQLKEEDPEAAAALPEDLVKQIEETEKALENLDKSTDIEKLLASTELTLDSWNPEVKKALNDMIAANSGKENKYVVFDFDNTCSIYDVEEQLAVYQLQRMAFDETVDAEKLEDMLKTELNPDYFEEPAAASADYCGNPDATYQDWIDDIVDAYEKLLDSEFATDGHFTPAGLTDEQSDAIQKTDDWKEFATKMRAMYDCVFDSESAAVAYPWVLYWFTGMSHDEVYELAKASHSFYKEQTTKYVTWSTPGTGSKIKDCKFTWSYGTQVSDNIVELISALDNNGIDVWVCSASATDPIRAAIDVWGLHDHVTGMMAMTNVYDKEKNEFINDYDYKTGCAWIPKAEGKWEEGTVATKAQTQGKGKVTAVQNVCGKEYGCGPIAGFMDSTGDYNFCTEFEDLEVVCCFNRASRKVTDGGGVIAEVAVYEADTLGYDYAKAREAGDTLYVLQARDERGLRGFLPQRETIRVTSDGVSDPKLFANKDNQTQLDYMIANEMTVEDIINQFAIKTAKGAEGNPFDFKYGFLTKYDGYHSQTGDALDAITALKHEDWNPEVRDALNDMMVAEHDNDQYVVFDFDNTCSIFDVEEQLAIYQLQTMAFDETVDAAKLADILETELDKKYFKEKAPASGDYCGNPDATYQDWIDDITAAFAKLDEKYDFTPAGLTEAQQEEIQKTDDWKEFATKMRAMYDCVFDSESAAVAYPWVLYWFTGMTEEEVYQLAYRSHDKYRQLETDRVTWKSPYDEDKTIKDEDGNIISFDADTAKTKIGYVKFTWNHGTQVSENIVELWKALDENGIDVWICSASATDPIRAAIDVWGGHDYITGMMAMTNKLDSDGKYINKYDWDGGNAWLTTDKEENHGWVKDKELQKTQTQGKGKVIAIQNVLYPKYDNHGPIAGFMDSTGDYNFCTEFETLQVVTCFNRADRKETDGGGVIAETAVYEADTLGYNYAAARAKDDTLYVLQGRNELGLRSFNPGRATNVFKQKDDEKGGLHVFGSEYGRGNNEAQLKCMIDNELDVETIINDFAIKSPKGTNEYGLPFKYGFVYGTDNPEGLGPKFHDDTYNPDDLDFSGYHSQK